MENIQGQPNGIDSPVGNPDPWEYKRRARNRALARALTVLGFEIPRLAMHQEGLLDPQLNSAVDRALREGRVSREDSNELFETDLVISALDNRHAVIEASITADADDISNAKERAGILAEVTGGTVTPVVITSGLDPAQSAQAEAEGVRVFVIPYR